MKMDVYKVIRESKNSTLLNTDELEKLYSFANDAILMRIAASEKEDEEDIQKFAEIVLKNKDDYFFSKKEDKEEEFKKELNSEIKKAIKKDRNEIKEKLFDKINNIAKDYKPENLSDEKPNIIVFKLFLNEWNTKYAFTWKAFKEVKKTYEKTHILEGEDLFVLKSFLEKDPKIARKTGYDDRRVDFEKGKISKLTIGKITDTTVFSKSNNTLSKDTIEKIKEKIKESE